MFPRPSVLAFLAATIAFAGTRPDEFDGKQVLAASILLAADSLATAAIFKDGKALTSEELKEFLITKEESDVNRRCYGAILDWISANPRRFDPVDSNSGESWGIVENKYAFINKSVFENFLKNNGYSFKPFMNWARLHGKLKFEDHGEGDERRLTVRKVLPSGRLRCVAIRIDDLQEQEAYQLAANEIPDDMPF